MKGIFSLSMLFHFWAIAKPSNTDLYKWTEQKVKEVFQVEYQEDIVLQGIYFLENWDCVKGSSAESVKDAAGVFNNMYLKEHNQIYITDHHALTYPVKSVIVHELVHFFTKKAGWSEDFNGIDRHYDSGLVEAIAYYIQELWLQEQGDTLFNYLEIEEKHQEEVDNFYSLANLLYAMAPAKFLYNVPLYFADEQPEKFDDIMGKWGGYGTGYGWRINNDTEERIEALKTNFEECMK